MLFLKNRILVTIRQAALIGSVLTSVSCSSLTHGQTADVEVIADKNIINSSAPLSDPENDGDWVYKAALSDEFNGTDFDRNVWHNMGENGDYKGQWKGRAPSQYNPDNIRVGGGYLYLTSQWQPDFEFAEGGPRGNATSDIGYGEIAPVTTAALLGLKTFEYGYMEMRAKKADGPISSSFWTTGPGGETDAFESFGKNPKNRWSERRVHTSLHDWRKGSPTLGKRIWDLSHILDFRVADDFNTYGFEWDPNYLAIYMNGGLVKCMSKAELGNRWVANAPHRIWIDSEIFDWEVKPEELKPSDFGENGIDFVVDYARVYQRRDPDILRSCQPRENLIENGGFENGQTGWPNIGAISSDAFKGDSALTLTGKQRLARKVSVKPNTTYVLSAAIAARDTNMKDKWSNAYMGVEIDRQRVNDVRYFFPQWKESSLQFTTDADDAEVTVYITNAPQGGTIDIDEVGLFEMSKPPHRD